MRLHAYCKPWRDTVFSIRSYFIVYGGFTAVFTSPYVHVALCIGILAAQFSGIRFGDIGASVLPNVLGFTIGAMAIVLSIASSEFFMFLAEKGEPRSFFMKLIANFLHYIIAQAATIVLCVFEKSQACAGWLNYIAATMFIFSILSPVAMGTQLFQMARLYNAKAGVPIKPQRPPRLPMAMRRRAKL